MAPVSPVNKEYLLKKTNEELKIINGAIPHSNHAKASELRDRKKELVAKHKYLNSFYPDE